MNVKLINTYIYILIFLAAFGLSSLDTLASEKKLGLKTVVIDAGHGGKDPGGVSRDKKTYEKNLVLDIAKRFGRKIQEKHPDVKVIYTRTTDVYLTLNQRAEIANKNNADLFISIHTNASNSSSVHGASVHILGESSNPNRDLYASNMDVCRRENSVILLEDDYSTNYQGFDPTSPESFIFFNLMQNAHYEQSILFASEVDKYLRKTSFAVSNYTGIHQDPFWLLWKTAMPAVLLELGFISNASDLKVLISSNGREDIANKLCAAFTSFKKAYDSSLDMTVEESQASGSGQITITSSPKDYYGIQIMGLSRVLKPKDPALKGLTAEAIKVDGKVFYKYVTGKWETAEQARKNLATVRKKFPEAFVVSVSGRKVTRVK